MMHRFILIFLLVSCVTAAFAEEPNASEGKIDTSEEELLSGMSIVGNDEAPKSLVIVPWKSSAMGNTLDVSRMLDDGRRAVDREVFMRELGYYEIRSGHRATDQ
jgi:hypothetical protein